MLTESGFLQNQGRPSHCNITEFSTSSTLAGTAVANVGISSCQANSPISSGLSVTIPPIAPGAQVGPGGSSSGGPSPTSDGSQGSSGMKGEMVDNDAEGVWSPDIEQSFHEALAIYPPCGRRKIILSDEGKMYGRNELIARYIKLRTGKTRTRKQVSSHIQVLARRKSRELHSQFKTPRGTEGGGWHPFKDQINVMDQATKDKVLQSMANMSSAQIVSAGVIPNNNPQLGLSSGIRPPYQKPHGYWAGVPTHPEPADVKPFRTDTFGVGPPGNSTAPVTGVLGGPSNTTTNALMAPGYGSHLTLQEPLWQGRQIATHNLRLVDFSAFLEQQHDVDNYSKHLFVHINHTNPSITDPRLESIDIHQIYDKFPDKKQGLRDLFEKGPKEAFFLVKFWADLNVNISEDSSAFYGVTSQFESAENMTITCSTKVCSFGKQVVEKVETEYARFENGRFVYRIHRSPMCEYMINFILKLKHLPETYMMNSVLENFTILQVVSNRETNETLLCMAYVFEVSTSEHGAQHHIYQLVGDSKP